ncbi:MAG TPA: polyribonucleotide nucleotidyltransferase [Candidatus Vogelbacteria bacterium]|nr:polyribonucleotide nucleotidyltransferase [Candidatus Vogelbacteria bacterium]
MLKKEYSIDCGGKVLTATFNDMAEKANGSVMIKYGQTVVLVTACMGDSIKENMNYFPLTVDYEEKFYAAGLILGGRFIKREGRPSEEAILAGRAIDRTIRPLFDQRIRNEVQVIATVLSIDDKVDPDVPAIIGASLALATSNIPWNGPVSAVRLGQQDNKFIINPDNDSSEDLDLNLLICGKDEQINMIEAEAKEIKEDVIGQAFDLAIAEVEKIQAWQKDIIKEIGQEKMKVELKSISEEIISFFKKEVNPTDFHEAIFSGPGHSGSNKLKQVWLDKIKENLGDEYIGQAEDYWEEKVNDILHDKAINNQQRADGRALDELRSLYAEVGNISEIIHGAGIFYRGQTHILSVLTLSGPKDSQLIEGMELRTKKYFMHHYNFPPFSVGETGRLGGMNRRAIGHGALAEKSLKAVLPTKEKFPYTIRLVSEVLTSNGSTSMGSVCACSLALLDGGVPISRPVAGIAMGLMYESPEKYAILTDIQGPEDSHGDMDFKVAGTTKGITGIQMDIKIGGINPKILKEALIKARQAREEIIEKITSVIPSPRADLKPSAPQIEIIKIPVDKIGAVIGPSGKTIQKITEETGVEIEIEDDGSVYISGKKEGLKQAKEIVEDITRVYEVGQRYNGKVSKIMNFGAFIKIGRDLEGLVHISEIAPFRVEKITDFLKEGQEVPIVIKEIDDRGRYNFSIKQADPNLFSNKKN